MVWTGNGVFYYVVLDPWQSLGGRVERRRGKGGRLAVLRVIGMYSKHRQKNNQVSPAKCGRLFVFLSFLLLGSIPERARGNTGEQGKESSKHARKLLLASTSCVSKTRFYTVDSWNKRFEVCHWPTGLGAGNSWGVSHESSFQVICPYMKKRTTYAKFRS